MSAQAVTGTDAAVPSPTMMRSRWWRPTRARAALTLEETDRVRAVLYLSGLRGADLADAAQEVQLRVLERAPDGLRFRGAWACAVAANLARDWHRRAGRARVVESELARTSGSAVTDPDLALKGAVAAGLARLEPDLRAVVVLRFYARPVGGGISLSSSAYGRAR